MPATTGSNVRGRDPAQGSRGRSVARAFGRAFLATWRLLLVVVFVVGGIAIGGFLNFVHQVRGTDAAAAASAPKAEAVAVLTGGARRIDVGLELLSEGRAERMLISGVNERTSGAAIADAARGATDESERARLFACCIDLGRDALDTVGNAAEARDWIRERGFSHVLVVTADYHMPRSLLEFRRALADGGAGEVEDGGEGEKPVRLTPWPVTTAALQADGWYADPPAIRRMVGEWGKYLSAQSKGWFGAEFLKEWFPSA